MSGLQPGSTGIELALAALSDAPAQFERVLAVVPPQFLTWEPPDWEAIPGERFSALGQLCHVRDIEIEGYHVRFQRMFEEVRPDLVSLDSYEIARRHDYARADPARAVASFRAARVETIARLRRADQRQLERRGTFAEYGEVSVRGLVHILCSHDQQHLACLHWLLARIASVKAAT